MKKAEKNHNHRIVIVIIKLPTPGKGWNTNLKTFRKIIPSPDDITK